MRIRDGEEITWFVWIGRDCRKKIEDLTAAFENLVDEGHDLSAIGRIAHTEFRNTVDVQQRREVWREWGIARVKKIDGRRRTRLSDSEQARAARACRRRADDERNDNGVHVPAHGEGQPVTHGLNSGAPWRGEQLLPRGHDDWATESQTLRWCIRILYSKLRQLVDADARARERRGYQGKDWGGWVGRVRK